MDSHLPLFRQPHKLLPGDISTFSGEVVDTDHVEEVSGQTVSGSGSTWTDVHRELWIRPSRGTERRFTLTNMAVPARKGHRVTLLLEGGRPLAIINFSTEQYLNLVTPSDFDLVEATEVFVFAALLVGVGVIGLAGLASLAIAASVYVLLKWRARQERYRDTRATVEAEIQQTVAHTPWSQ